MDRRFARCLRPVSALPLWFALAVPCCALAAPAATQHNGACMNCRGYLLGAAALVVAQGAALAALLVNRRRYRRAEEEHRRQRDEFLHLSRLAIVGELTASIAHEINQPLGAILSNADAAELLLDSGEADPALLRQILADIRRDDIRASEVIGHIRALLGKRTVEPCAVDLAQVADNALRLTGAEAGRRGVAVELRIEVPLPPVLGDQVQLEQVVLNLLLNGMQAMADTPEPGRRLQLHIAADRYDQVALAVSDAGEGIPPERFPQLFRSFFTTRDGGMGLGLAIARSIVEAHGGSIHAANRPGGGAVFRVVLPAITSPAPGSETDHEQIRTHRSYC